LHRQELPALPGLLAVLPPRKTARGRENDRLIVYLVLTGNATLSTAEYLQLASLTANRFFETAGALTTAMRTAAEALNRALLDRNLGSTARGQYAVGSLVLAALRGTQCTLLQSGPTHIYTLGSEAITHTFDPALSGKGMGLSQATATYFTQTDLQAGDRLIFSGKTPDGWDQAISQVGRDSIESTRRRLFSLTKDDLNAVLIRATEGTGHLTVLRPAAPTGQTLKEIFPANEPAAPPAGTGSLPPSQDSDSDPQAETSEPETRKFTPSAYAIPPQPVDNGLPEIEEILPRFPASIPRATPGEPGAPALREMDEPIMDEPKVPRQPSEATRAMARGLVGGMRASRRMGDTFTRNLGRFIPSLLPGSESGALPSPILMAFIAIVVPLIVVAAGVTAYLRFGHSIEYSDFYMRAEEAYTQAISATDPVRQRDWWDRVLFYLDEAERYRETEESQAMRQEAQSKRDALLGIQRLDLYPAFVGAVNAQITRLAANETDLFMLDAEQGRVLHAARVGNIFELDQAFRCEQGEYGDYHVGPIVDILTLPRLNSLNAAVLGIDAGGNLLYWSAGQVGQAIPLPLPDTNWGRVTGFAYDSGNLYVLDAPSRAVWVYTGRDASFSDSPYFFFGGQIPDIEDSIDLVVNGDEMYLLHADGHLSHCSYSRLDTVPTRCEDPVTLINNIPAYQDIDLFGQSHITQMMLTSPPDSTLLLLDADNRGVMRLSPRTLELQNQIRPKPGTSLKQGPASAMAVNPNRVLFISIDDQVYFATDMP